jgi:HD-like signal output (HDOD) protein
MASSTSSNNSFSIYRTSIEQVMRGQERLPSLPTITLKIRRAAADPNTTIQNLSDMIGQDPSLTVVVMHHSRSPLFKTRTEAKSLEDAIRLMGIPYVVNLVMIHSLKSLFLVQNPGLKALFAISWKRQALKASMSRFLAVKLGMQTPDEAFISSLLSEVGTLAILSALSETRQVPDQVAYLRLCRAYSKSLAVIILKKWDMDSRYVEIARGCGEWQQVKSTDNSPLTTLDVVNLSLYHSVSLLKRDHSLPALTNLDCYQRLPASLAQLSKNGLLQLVMSNLKEIVDSAQTLH